MSFYFFSYVCKEHDDMSYTISSASVARKNKPRPSGSTIHKETRVEGWFTWWGAWGSDSEGAKEANASPDNSGDQNFAYNIKKFNLKSQTLI